MLNTRDLEKRWLHYKIKYYIPHAVIFVSTVVIVIIVLILTAPSKTTEDKKSTTINITKNIVQTKPIVKTESEQNITTIQETIKPIAAPQQTIAKVPLVNSTKKTKLTLAPSMNFIRHIQSEEQQPYYSTMHPEVKKFKKSKKRDKIVQQQSTVEEEYIDINKNEQKKDAPKVQKVQELKHIITIERRDSQKDIKEIITRFKKNNNPALSLFVAKKYYELGNYEQAYNYALITNGINNDIEESWLIFAKSLVKLHKRDMAIKTLREYIHYSHSGNAKILLDDIKSGAFK